MDSESAYALLSLSALAFFYLATQTSLGGRSQRQLDEATMLPFADDEPVARRMERATGRSSTGCSCPGRCDGSCARRVELEA
ncbi:cbb3-type cytochrome c oxidase subunit 3 [Pseudomonas sp. BN102]|uniref:cbb3-type cytochrome c oxidase subunit 3 n=1 Tax=Pseudomonas sp. BN102 TaxID=2567886 RepID=UPI002454E9DD|nr:cbb3-type cytochrome c oxidase subunit 3 [Pseudomonas sp. BN102]MDH4608273.1 cbb3-type cytochrome c oxidase subunit 3 [Pseudomonas sp. BN102]